jgi:hypothetical protein
MSLGGFLLHAAASPSDVSVFHRFGLAIDASNGSGSAPWLRALTFAHPSHISSRYGGDCQAPSFLLWQPKTTV